MSISRQDAINDALERLSDLGFVMEPFFSEHGPMVAEALSALGQNDAVAGWVNHYRGERRHLPMPPAREPIDGTKPEKWRAALGVYGRSTDWLNYFHREFEDRPWREVTARWLPVLLPGYIGGLTHGLIRTAHALRSFPEDGSPTTLQLDELARGMAYWAASFRQIAGDVSQHGDLALDRALQELPRLEPRMRSRQMTEAAGAAMFTELPGFASAIQSLAMSGDVGEAISAHTATFARVLLAHSEMHPVPLIHTITAPALTRVLLPYIPPDSCPNLYRWLWQGSAAVLALFATALPRETQPNLSPPRLELEELIGRAVESGDAHTIKLTAACLREDRIHPDPVYRAVLEAVIERTGA